MRRSMAASGAVAMDVDAAEAPVDPFVQRERLVRAAVEALGRALGDGGATYFRQAKEWERKLDRRRKKLAPFPHSLVLAGLRLPAPPSALARARDDFVAADGVNLGARQISVTIGDAQLIHGPEGLSCFELARGAREPLPAPLSHCEAGAAVFADWKDAPEAPPDDGSEPAASADDLKSGARPSTS